MEGMPFQTRRMRISSSCSETGCASIQVSGEDYRPWKTMHTRPHLYILNGSEQWQLVQCARTMAGSFVQSPAGGSMEVFGGHEVCLVGSSWVALE